MFLSLLSVAGTIPSTFDNMSGLMKFSVLDNQLEGRVPRAVLTISKEYLQIQPQAGCLNTTYIREAISADNLGWCIPLPKASFTAFEAKESLNIQLTKAPGARSMTFRIVVVAYKTSAPSRLASFRCLLFFSPVGPRRLGSESCVMDAAGIYGIQKGWLDRGLGSADVQLLCTDHSEPTPCLPNASCSTVWLRSEDCSRLNTSHIVVRIDRDSFEPGSAVVLLDAFVRSLPERTYRFSVALPLYDNTTWQWRNISGEFNVVSVASATNSEVLLGPMAIERPAITGSRGKSIAVVAIDIDGNLINRSGDDADAHAFYTNQTCQSSRWAASARLGDRTHREAEFVVGALRVPDAAV